MLNIFFIYWVIQCFFQVFHVPTGCTNCDICKKRNTMLDFWHIYFRKLTDEKRPIQAFVYVYNIGKHSLSLVTPFMYNHYRTCISIEKLSKHFSLDQSIIKCEFSKYVPRSSLYSRHCLNQIYSKFIGTIGHKTLKFTSHIWTVTCLWLSAWLSTRILFLRDIENKPGNALAWILHTHPTLFQHPTNTYGHKRGGKVLIYF